MISIMIAISKFKYLILVPFILFISCSVGAPIDEYSAEVWKSPNGGSINYRYRLPYKVEEGKKIGWKDGIRAIYCILKYNIYK